MRAESRRERGIFEIGAALIVVERRRVAGEVSFDEIEIAVQIVIRGRDTHTRLRLSIRTESASRFNRNILKLSILLVLVESARGRIVRHINVRPAVVVQVRRQNSQAISAIRAENPRRLGNVGESPITIVVVKNVLTVFHARRPARDHHTLIKTRPRFRHRRSRQVESDVVGDEEIEFAVAIVVDEGTPCTPARALARNACLLAHIGERAVTVVVIHHILAKVGDEQIIPTIVVIISNTHALSPARVSDAGFGRHIRECAVAIVAKQM